MKNTTMHGSINILAFYGGGIYFPELTLNGPFHNKPDDHFMRA